MYVHVHVHRSLPSWFDAPGVAYLKREVFMMQMLLSGVKKVVMTPVEGCHTKVHIYMQLV